MTLRAEEEFILFKLNAGAYGSADTPAALHAIATYDISYNQNFQRENMAEALGYPGAPSEKVVGGWQELSFKVYARGTAGATPGAPVPYAPLLRAAGNSETITPDVSVSYAPVSENFEHGTLYYYIGGSNGVLHKMVGVRISAAKLVTNVGALPYYEFTALGLDVEPEPAGARPEVDWSGLTVPLHTAANTVQTMTLFGTNVGMATLSTTLGNTFSHLHVTNQEEIAFENRVGAVDISIVEPDPSVINYWTKAKKGEQGSLQFQLGKDADHAKSLLLLNIPNLQLSSVSRRKDAGKLYLDLKLNIKPLSKNSDYTITTK